MGHREIGQKVMGFAAAERSGELDEMAGVIDWTPLAARLDGISRLGRVQPGWPPLAPFKALLLGFWHDLSDVRLAEALDDRASFRRFCGVSRSEPVPERTAFVHFRRELVRRRLEGPPFDGERGQARLEPRHSPRPLPDREGLRHGQALLRPRPDSQAGLPAGPPDVSCPQTPQSQGDPAPRPRMTETQHTEGASESTPSNPKSSVRPASPKRSTHRNTSGKPRTGLIFAGPVRPPEGGLPPVICQVPAGPKSGLLSIQGDCAQISYFEHDPIRLKRFWRVKKLAPARVGRSAASPGKPA